MSTKFAKNLKAYRTLAHMTQTDFAKAVGITRSVVNNYELGRSEPSFENLCRMATVLGVELSDLVDGGEEIPDYIRRIQVTDEESALIQAYRRADPVYRGVAMEILKNHRKDEK